MKDGANSSLSELIVAVVATLTDLQAYVLSRDNIVKLSGRLRKRGDGIADNT